MKSWRIRMAKTLDKLLSEPTYDSGAIPLPQGFFSRDPWMAYQLADAGIMVLPDDEPEEEPPLAPGRAPAKQPRQGGRHIIENPPSTDEDEEVDADSVQED